MTAAIGVGSVLVHRKINSVVTRMTFPDGEVDPDSAKYQGACACGWVQEVPTANKGAAGFAATAHVAKATGRPVFGVGTKAHEAVERLALDVPESADATPEAIQGANGATIELVPFPTAPDPATWVGRTDGYTMPATMVTVPSDEYAVTKLRTWRGWDGVGYEATLTRNGKAIARIHDEGHGGETNVEFADGRHPYDHQSPEGRAFDQWVARLPEYTRVWCEADDDASYGTELPWSFAGAIDVLIAEAEVAKSLSRKKNTPILKPGQSPTRAFGTLNTPDVHKTAAWCVKQGPGWKVWHKGAWTPAEDVA